MTGNPGQNVGASRRAALQAYDVLGTSPELAFDDLAQLAARACAAPVALVTFVDETAQYFKARVGFEGTGAPLEAGFCPLVVEAGRELVIADTLLDPAHAGNVAVRENGVRFYAGVPLVAEADLVLGTLCVLDSNPRPAGLTDEEGDSLRRIARQVVILLQLRRTSRKLDRVQDDLRRAQEAGRVGLFWIDIEQNLIHATPEFCRLYGLPDQEVFSAAVPEQLLISDDTAVMSNAASRGSGTASLDVQYRVRRADTQEIRWLARRAEFECDAEGHPRRFFGAVRDITEDVKARERFQLALDATKIGIFDFDPRSGELQWDERLRELFGVSADTPVGYEDAFLAGLHPSDRATAHEAVQTALDPTGPGVFEIEYRVCPLDGSSERWIAARGQAIVAGGQTVRFVGTARDVTTRRRAEEKLATLNATLEQQVDERTRERNRIWETTNDLMGAATLGGYLKSVNPAWTPLLGWNEAELLGRPFLEFVDPADHAETAEVVGRLAAGETVTGFIDRVLARNGDKRAIMWTAVPEPGTDLFHIVGRDLTDLQQAQDALRQAQKMEAVGQLTGGIAHDFNNLLTGIAGSLELLTARVAQGRVEEVDRYVEAAHGAAKRAAALTHRLLAFSRRQTLDPKPTNVNRLVSGMAELIRRTVGPEITLSIVEAGELWTVLVDPPQLENALLNLCINARDAMQGGGRITVDTANIWLDEGAARERDLAPGAYLSLCVTDTGTGMGPDIIAKAFDPFFTTKPIGQGTGLGLSMIYGFVRQSGGQVRIQSQVGQGTAVFLYFPRHEGAEGQGEDEALASPEALVGPVPTETVLVVDDEPTVRMLVTEILSDLGYNALEAPDGPAGLAVLRSDRRIDLLVTDVGLPGGMNGRQMAEAARADRPDLPVLFITGYAETAVIGGGRLDPGMAVVTKPFTVDALAAKIRDMMRG